MSREEPVLRIRASRMATKGRGFAATAFPIELAIYHDRVEEKKPGVVRQQSQSIRFTQVAQVAMKRGVPWCTLTIESTGGHTIRVSGLTRGDADQAKAEIEKHLGRGVQVELDESGEAPNHSASAADELVRLADMKERGLLTDEEFTAAKKSLLGL